MASKFWREAEVGYDARAGGRSGTVASVTIMDASVAAERGVLSFGLLCISVRALAKQQLRLPGPAGSLTSARCAGA